MGIMEKTTMVAVTISGNQVRNALDETAMEYLSCEDPEIGKGYLILENGERVDLNEVIGAVIDYHV